MKKFLWIIGYFLLVACSPSYTSIANREMYLFGKKQKKYGYRHMGGGGSMRHDIEEFIIGVDANRKLTLDEVRKEVIRMSLDFAHQIENNLKIHKHLHDQCYTIEKLNLIAAYVDEHNHFVSEGDYVAGFLLLDGKIYYYHYNPATDEYKDFYSETHQEAYRKVYGEEALLPYFCYTPEEQKVLFSSQNNCSQ